MPDRRAGSPSGPGRSCAPGVGLPVGEGTEDVIGADLVGELGAPVDPGHVGRVAWLVERRQAVKLSESAMSASFSLRGELPLGTKEEGAEDPTGVMAEDKEREKRRPDDEVRNGPTRRVTIRDGASQRAIAEQIFVRSTTLVRSTLECPGDELAADTSSTLGL